MATKTCPLCKKTLSLKQVNFNLAVYICEDLKCKYPVGYDCIVVERKLEDMHKEMAHDDSLNDWVDQVVSNSQTTESNSPVSIDVQDEQASENSVEWIDNLLQEAVKQTGDYGSLHEVTTSDNSSTNTDFDDILNFIYSN